MHSVKSLLCILQISFRQKLNFFFKKNLKNEWMEKYFKYFFYYLVRPALSLPAYGGHEGCAERRDRARTAHLQFPATGERGEQATSEEKPKTVQRKVLLKYQYLKQCNDH